MSSETPDYLTLAECAADVRVDVEVVRRWCIAWEKGDANGLPFTHFGKKLDDQPGRKNRRVLREDWKEFKAKCSRRQASETRETHRQWERAPLQIPTRKERQEAALVRGR